jgi:hypothetical protein
MVETLTRNTIEKENQNQIEYMNAFGIVFEKYFVVYNSSTKIKININDTKNVRIQKSRIMTKNIVLISVALNTVIGCYYLNVLFVYKLIFILFATILIIIGVYFKEYQYKFTITKQDDRIVFIVNKKLKEEAKKIQRVLAEKLKEK